MGWSCFRCSCRAACCCPSRGCCACAGIRLSSRTLRAHAGKKQLLARHDEPGARLDRALGVLPDAPRDLDHAAARIAADVLVVVLRHLVVDFSVTQVDALDDAVPLHPGHGPKNCRVVRGPERLHDGFVELVDRPEVLLLGLEKGSHMIPDPAGPRLRRPDYPDLPCAIHLFTALSPMVGG